MKDISLLVGCKNNLDYTKHFYKTTRNIYTDAEMVFVSYGSTDGTHEWLLDLQHNDNNVIVYVNSESKTLSDTYNKAAEIATKTWMIFCHNDMVISDMFLENILQALTHSKICVTYTTIEPPIFPGPRAGKLIADYGSDLQSFRYNEFINSCKRSIEINRVHSYEGWTFFMAMNRLEYLKLGGMDNLFNPMFCEDDDLYTRLVIENFEFKVISNALVYHFVSKTSRFSEEHKNNTSKIETKSNRNFIRKWGFRQSIYKVSRPIGCVLKYDKIHIYDANFLYQIIQYIEPYFNKIYLNYDEYDMKVIQSYIENEGKQSERFNLQDKFIINNEFSVEEKYCLVIDFSNPKFNLHATIDIISSLQDVITNLNLDSGKYELTPYIHLVVYIK